VTACITNGIRIDPKGIRIDPNEAGVAIAATPGFPETRCGVSHMPARPMRRGPRLTTDQLMALLDALAIAPPAFRRMALLARGMDAADDTPDGLIGLDPDVAAELCARTLARFGSRAEDKAA
jgi:hypothetical protein